MWSVQEKKLIASHQSKTPVSDMVLLKDKKTLALANGGHSFELINWSKAKSLFADKVKATKVLEIPGQKVLVGDMEGSLNIYSYENIRKVNCLKSIEKLLKG